MPGTFFKSLASGSSGNCSVITDGEFMLVIDFGISLKRFTAFLNDEGLEPDSIALMISHEHSDHAGNVKLFRKKISGEIYARRKTLEACGVSGYAMQENMAFGSFSVSSVGVSHDAVDPVGFVIERSGRKISVVTDLGTVSEGLIDAMSGSSIIGIEANHDLEMLMNGRYPEHLKRRISGPKGHLSNDQCASLVASVYSDDARVILMHLSKENNRPEIARSTVISAMVSAGISSPDVMVATQEAGSDKIFL